MTAPRWRDVLTEIALRFVGLAAFPKLAYRLRWPTRLGPRGLVAYIAFNTLLFFAVRTWLVPYFKRIAEEHERLKERLGREPTNDELAEHFGFACDR